MIRLLALAWVGFGMLLAQPPAGGKWKLQFSDEFAGSALDSAKWIETESSTQRPKVSGGILRLAAGKAGGIGSRQEFGYGYYEARIKLPPGKGLHTRFRLMKAVDKTNPDRRFQEIDVCDPDPGGYSVDFQMYKPHAEFGYRRIVQPEGGEGFHVYGAEFGPSKVDFYRDGTRVHTVDISAVPHSTQNILLSAVGGEASVDWVRYYAREEAAAPAVAADLDLASMIQPAPESAKMIDPDFYIWCGTMVRGDDGKYHLYYSRWPRKLGHNAWVTNSEVAHAVGDSPFGVFHFVDVALPARGKEYWDGLCTHNPTVLRIGNKYYLYYMGNTGDGQAMKTLNWVHRNHQRIGVAVAEKPGGPWTRMDRPVLDVSADPHADDALMTSNPAVTVRPEGGVLMVYKAVASRKPLPFGGPVVHLTATAASPTGPFTKQGKPIFTVPGVNFAAEDPFVWYDYGRRKYEAIVKDNEGHFTHAGKSLALWESEDGFEWKLGRHALVAKTEIRWADGRTQKLNSLERPQLMFGPNGQPQALLCAVDETSDRTHSFNVRIPLQAGSAGEGR